MIPPVSEGQSQWFRWLCRSAKGRQGFGAASPLRLSQACQVFDLQACHCATLGRIHLEESSRDSRRSNSPSCVQSPGRTCCSLKSSLDHQCWKFRGNSRCVLRFEPTRTSRAAPPGRSAVPRSKRAAGARSNTTSAVGSVAPERHAPPGKIIVGLYLRQDGETAGKRTNDSLPVVDTWTSFLPRPETRNQPCRPCHRVRGLPLRARSFSQDELGCRRDLNTNDCAAFRNAMQLAHMSGSVFLPAA